MSGRGAELELLREALADAEHGRRLAVVAGEPGIGKTRLVSQFATGAHSEGSTVLLGRASAELAKPYLPFVEAFGGCLEHAPPAMLAGSGGELSELSRLVPESAERLGESTARKDSPASEQFALFKAALTLLRLVSREAPLVLVLEDLHWADDATLLMLHYLLTGRGEFRGLIVLTHRPADAAPAGSLPRMLAGLGRDPGFVAIDLPPLSDEETLSLLASLAGGGTRSHDPELAAALRRETGGNPLLTTELIRSLLASGALVEVEDGWHLREELDSAPLPAFLVNTIEQRVRDVGEGAPEALATAAVAGDRFDPDVVERALDREPGGLTATWHAAERAALLRAEERGLPLSFRHPIVRRALRDGLGPVRRTRFERRIAGALRTSDDRGVTAAASLELRGDHWALLSGEGELTLRDSKGVRYLARLLAAPGVEIHAIDLQSEALGSATPSPSVNAANQAGLTLRGSVDAGPMLDKTAKRQYRARIDELEAEIEEAEGFNDPERAANAREELEFIGNELAAAVGIGGRDRRATSEAERARVNVTRAVRSAISRIEQHDETIGGQLKASVRTGTFCCYEPVPGRATRWTVKQGNA